MVNWIGLGRAMSRLSASTYVEFHQATNHTFDPYMPIVVLGALLGGIVLASFSPGSIYLPFRHLLDVVGRGDSREELRGLYMAH